MRLDLNPATLDSFINGLLDQLRNHIQEVDDEDARRTTINEARQFLRGAHALCASAAIDEWPQQDGDNGTDGMAGLLNHMFAEAHAAMDEIADETLSLTGWYSRVVDGLHKHTEH